MGHFKVCLLQINTIQMEDVENMTAWARGVSLLLPFPSCPCEVYAILVKYIALLGPPSV